MTVNCEIEATVTSGLESVARDEIKEKLGIDSTSTRGHVFFKLPVDSVLETLKLMSIENLFVIIRRYPCMELNNEKDHDMALFRDIVPELDWSVGLDVWSKFHTFAHTVSPSPLSDEDILRLRSEFPDLPRDDRHRQPHYSFLPRFRATCYRTGQNHNFSSEDVAREFGGKMNDYFHWGVDMEDYDIESVITVIDREVRVSLALTEQSLFRRNIAKFGPTTLKPTIAYSLLRLCEIEVGDVVCDPMCGGGTIPIEGALNWPEAHHICGDIHDMAWQRAAENIDHVTQKCLRNDRSPLDVTLFRWDSCRLPLRDECVDVMTSDLPFGKRSGSRMRNTVLYPRTLLEMARVTKRTSGRACLLTHDKKCLHRTLLSLSRYWRWTSTVGVNIGGLAAAAFLLRRTDLIWTPDTADRSKRKTKTDRFKVRVNESAVLQTDPS